MIAYHGTRQGVVDSIRARGLWPDNSTGAVYLTADLECAEHFAITTAEYHGDQPVLIVVELPDDTPVQSLSMGPWDAIEHDGPIPPAWIVEARWTTTAQA